jgi:hypothetical protein
MSRKLTPDQIAQYERDGYICPIDAFAPDRAAAWHDRLRAFERAEGQTMTRGHNFKPHLLFPWVDEIVHAPEILDAVEDLIGPDIRLFHLSVWPKDPGTGTYVSWHQDATYFALDPICHVTAWVALTDAPVESGCMEVVPGSHKLGQLRHADMQDTDNLLSRGQTLTAEVDRSRTVLHGGEGRAVSRCITRTWCTTRGPTARAIAVSDSASATSRPMRAARRAPGSRRCWCAAATPTAISTTSGRPRSRPAPQERAFHAEAVATFRRMNAEIAGAPR